MPSDPTAHSISSVAPGATTTELAGQQPLEKDKPADLPGAFPETPAAAKEDEKTNGLGAAALAAGGLVGAGGIAAAAASGKKDEEQTFSINPIPASQDAGNPVLLQPGEKVPDPSTINDNTISSTVQDDAELKSKAQEAEQTVSVNPLPATGGTSNPIHLQPGEPVPDPSTISTNTVVSNVKLDQTSYEKSDAGAPVLPPASSAEAEPSAAGGALLGGLGPQTTNIIPESSLGMGSDAPAPLEGSALSSVGANSTTNQLAGQVPLEPRGVPTVVTESQKEAGEPPEAAANPEAVLEKKEVESELKKTVPEEQPTSGTQGGIMGAIAGGAAAASAAIFGAAAVAREKTKDTTGTDPVSMLPASVQKTVDDNSKPAVNAADAVPAEVKESQKEAHVAPEASANPEAVHEKSDVEKELLAKVPESQASGEPAPTVTAAATSTAPIAATTSASGALQHADPTAGVAALSLDDKSKGLNAPADAPAQTSSTHAAAVAEANEPRDSRDVSPMTKPTTATQTAPAVTTGVDSGTAPAQSTSTPVGTPRKGEPTPGNKRNSIIERLKGTPDSQKTTDSSGSTKKKGLFSRIKEKLKN